MLQQVLEHSAIKRTQRCSHLKPDPYGEAVLTAMRVDLARPAGAVVPLAPTNQPEEQNLTSPAAPGIEENSLTA